MTKDNPYKTATGFLIIILLILFSMLFFPTGPMPFSLTNAAIVANIFVAGVTGFLALATYRSVKVSEEQIDISRRMFELEEKRFLNKQIIDLIKSTLDPLARTISIELRFFWNRDITLNPEGLESYAPYQFMKYFSFFNSDERAWKIFYNWLHHISNVSKQDEKINTIIPLFEDRWNALAKCGISLRKFSNLFNDPETGFSDLIVSHSPIEDITTAYDEESEEEHTEEFVVFRGEKDIEIRYEEWEELIQSLLVFDLMRRTKNLSLERYIDGRIVDVFIRIRDDFLRSNAAPQLTAIKNELDEGIDQLQTIDTALLKKLVSLRDDLKILYSITSEDLEQEIDPRDDLFKS